MANGTQRKKDIYCGACLDKLVGKDGFSHWYSAAWPHLLKIIDIQVGLAVVLPVISTPEAVVGGVWLPATIAPSRGVRASNGADTLERRASGRGQGSKTKTYKI